jgi:hypothetical protein
MTDIETQPATATVNQGRWALRRAVWLGFGILLMQLGAGLPVPIYPRYQTVLGLPTAALSGLFVALVAGIVAALLVVVPVSAAIGQRRVLLACCYLSILAIVMFAVAGSLWLLLTAQALQGLVTGGFSGAAPPAMSHTPLPGGTVTVSRLVTAGNAAGLAIGPLWSGPLLQFAPLPGILVFVCQIVLLAGVAIAVRHYVSPPRLNDPGPTLSGLTELSPAHRRLVVIASAGGFCAFAIGGFYSALGPITVRDLLQVTSETILGLVVSLLFTAHAVAAATLIRLPIRLAWRIGLALVLAGLALIAISPRIGGVALFLCATIILGAGQGTIIAVGITVTSLQASAIALFFLVSYLGAASSATIAGLIAEAATPRTALTAFCVSIGVASDMLALINARDPRELQ